MGAEILPWVLTTGWASGINAYAVVLIMGLAERIWQVAGIPAVLGRTDVLIGAGVLFVIEMVADKIPYLDSAWDSIHTVVRPAVGATIGYLLGHENADLNAAFTAATVGLMISASISAMLFFSRSREATVPMPPVFGPRSPSRRGL